MKKILPLLIILALTACSEEKKPQANTLAATLSAPKELKIASWNMEWLDTTPRESYQKRSEEDYKKLQDYAHMLNADLIAFQEVADTDSIEKVLGKDNYDIIISSRKNDQRTGFAIRKGIDYKKNAENKEISLNGSVRNGIDITVNNGSNSLRLLNVHLKSLCFTNEDEKRSNKKQDCQKFNKQVDILDEWIQEREAEGVAYAVLGDFNRRLKRNDDNAAQILTEEKGAKVLTFVGHKNASNCKNINKQGKTWSHSEFIDHIALSNKALQYYKTDSFSHHAYKIDDVEEYKLSDHCPISVKLAM